MFHEIQLRDGTVLPHKEHVTARMAAISGMPFYNPSSTEATSYKVLHNKRRKRVYATRLGNTASLWIRSGTEKLIVDTY